MPDPHLAKLAKLSRQKLEALADRTQKALGLLRDREIKTLADRVRAQAEELGIEIAELVSHLSFVSARRGRPAKAASEKTAVALAPSGGRKKQRSSVMKGKKVKPWFADASGNTWTGRGQPARFVREYVQGGGKLADLLVDPSKTDEAKRIEAKLKAMSGGRPAGAAKKRGKRGKR